MQTQTYTAEQTQQVLQLYAQGVNLELIAETLNKSTRSILSKLVREGVYQAEPKPQRRLKKTEIIEQLAELLHTEPEKLASLEKATHEHLQHLLDRVHQ